MYRDIDAAELAGRLGTGREPLVLDVRDPDEVAEWAIPGSMNIPVRELDRADRRAAPRPRGRRRVRIGEPFGRGRRRSSPTPVCGSRTCAAAWRRGARCTTGSSSTRATRASSRCGGGARVACRTSSAARRETKRSSSTRRSTPTSTSRSQRNTAGGSPTCSTPTCTPTISRAPEHWPIGRTPCCTSIRPTPSTSRSRRSTTATASRSAAVSTMSVAALRTPGHTEGSTIYFVGDRVVLTGDTLFVDGVGRPDLAERAEEFAHNLYRSLHDRVLDLARRRARAPRPLRRRSPRDARRTGRRDARDAAGHARAARLRRGRVRRMGDRAHDAATAELRRDHQGEHGPPEPDRGRAADGSRSVPTAARHERHEEHRDADPRRTSSTTSASDCGAPPDRCRRSNACCPKAASAARS